jgi:hypothetical protein
MKKIEQQLGGLVTRNLGSGNAFGEFDNADGTPNAENCDDSLGNGYTLDGMVQKREEMKMNQRIAMGNRADLINKLSDAQIKYDSYNALKKQSDTIGGIKKEDGKIKWNAEVVRLQQKVNEAYASTQASADAITKFELAYNCKLLKAQKENEKKDPSKRDPRLESAQPLNIRRLNNPPVDATASDVLKAKSEITTTSGSTTKKVLFIAGGLLLVAGVILFIRSRRK